MKFCKPMPASRTIITIVAILAAIQAGERPKAATEHVATRDTVVNQQATTAQDNRWEAKHE